MSMRDGLAERHAASGMDSRFCRQAIDDVMTFGNLERRFARL
jgi:hypothetical protein